MLHTNKQEKPTVNNFVQVVDGVHDNRYTPTTLDDDLFLLTAQEVQKYLSKAHMEPGWWWLRNSYGWISYNAEIMTFPSNGVPTYSGSTSPYNGTRNGGTRLAFQLDLSKVLFASAAEGEKSTAYAGSGVFGQLSAPGGSAKLTLIDESENSSRSGFSASVNGGNSKLNVSNGDSLTVSYSGVPDGDYVSAILLDMSGTVVYHASKTPDGSGVWELSLPDDLSDDAYTLKLFSEQQNGDKNTDYASSPVSVTLTIYEASITDNGNTTKYKTFIEAVSNAGQGSSTKTITLLANITEDYPLTAGQDTLKVKKNGFTLTITSGVQGKAVKAETDSDSVTTYTLVDPVAKIDNGETTAYYATFADAVTAAGAGSETKTITLLANIAESYALTADQEALKVKKGDFTLTVTSGEQGKAVKTETDLDGVTTYTLLNTVEIPSTNKEVTWSADGIVIPVDGMFTIPVTAGNASYAVTAESGDTGVGSFNENKLTVTKCGTFTVKVTTAETDTHAAGEATATLTVNKAEVSITATNKEVVYSADGIAIPAEGMFTITEGAGTATYSVTKDTGEGSYDAQTGKLTVTKCGKFTVAVSTAVSDTHKAGAETSATLTVSPTTISEVVVTGIEAPAATVALDTAAATSTANVTLKNSGAITWDPAAPQDGKAAYGTVYKATVTAEAAANYFFADIATATVNGQTATVSKNQDGTLAVSFTFAKTDLIPVTITAANKEVTWSSDEITIPMDGMFTISAGAGAASYTVDNGTGEGTYNAQTGKLSVTKCGTFTVKASTAATDTYAAGAETSATLTVNPVTISEVAVTGIDAPVGAQLLDTEAATTTANVTLASNGAITWEPAGTEGKADYATVYKATVTATAATNYAFADAVTVTVNGETVTGTKNQDGTLTISYTFAKTDLTPVTITAENQEVNYTLDGIDIPVDGMFTIPAGAGAAEYSVTTETGDTGTGIYNNGKLTVTQYGTFTVKVYTAATETHAEGEASAKLTVNKPAQTISADNLSISYDDTDKSVSARVTDPATGGGLISFAVKTGSEDYIEVNASSGALTIKKAGTATVVVSAAETQDYALTTKEVTVTIDKVNAAAATVTANNRNYDSTEQPLVNVDAATLSGGTMAYALGTNDSTAPTDGWTESVPATTDAGTYYVWYKVVGDDNHNGTEAAEVTVIVKKLVPVAGVDFSVEPLQLTYTGSNQTLVRQEILSGSGLTIQYSFDNGVTVETGLPSKKASGEYQIYYRVIGNETYASLDWAGPVIAAIKMYAVFSAPDFALPALLSEIGEEAFAENASLTTVDAGSCAKIDANAFRGCTNLKRIRLSQNCEIDDTAFAGCMALKVFAPGGGTTAAWCASHNINFVAETQS